LFSTMKINVKLFGTLSQRFPDYHPDQGLDVEIPEGLKVSDLLALLKISPLQGKAVVREGRFLSGEEELMDGSVIQIFQALQEG